MKRILTTVALVPIITWIILWGSSDLFTLTVAVVASLCWFEFSQIAAPRLPQFPRWAGYLPGWALLMTRDRVDVVVLTALAAMVIAMRGSKLESVLPSAGTFLLGLVYVFGAWKSALLLRGFSPGWLMFAIVVNWIGDSAAFYAGRAFGKHKLAPSISPAKTWEGSVASLIAGSVGAVGVLSLLVPNSNLPKALVLALIANAAGQVGDLAESAIKRGASVKDSGSMLPGHGGWLDRVDSSLFSMPVVYALHPWFS